jgi:phytoene desaturase (3,4-didehydrolycopene-forming)
MVPDDDGATTSPTASAVTTKIHDDDDDDSDNVDDDRLGPRKLRVVIVGGGVGGLAVAARIASSSTSSPPGNSVDITIIEKNPQIGGRCGSFWVEAPTTITRENNNNNNNSDNDDSDHVMGWYRHERGPSLLLLPHIYKQLFEETTNGKYDASHYGLDMVQCVPAYQVVFDDGDRIEVGFPDSENDKNGGDCAYAGTATIAGNRETTSRIKMDSYERDGARKWDDYLRITQAYLDCGLANFIEERLDIMSFPNFVWEGVIRDFAKAWPLKPHSDLLDSLFESTKLQALASFQDLYVGLEPYRNNDLFGGGVLRSTAPAVFGLLAAIELHPTNKKAGGMSNQTKSYTAI